jgi:hypothetical protein
MSNPENYALEQLNNWIHDAVESDATPQEIYGSIVESIEELQNYHKVKYDNLTEILYLLKGHRFFNFDMEKNHTDSTDKVVKWILPVEEIFDDDAQSYEYCITLPDDLLERAGLVEGDTIEWIDMGDGSCMIKKVNK